MIVWSGLIANGLLFAGAWWLAGYGFRQARTLDRILASAVLSFTWCLLGLEVLGTAGLLAIGPLVVWMGLLFTVGLAVRWQRPMPPDGSSGSENLFGTSELGDPARSGFRTLGRGRVGDAVALAPGQGGERRADLPPLFRGAVVEGRPAVPGGVSVRRVCRNLFSGQRRRLVHLVDGDLGK